MTPSDFHTLNKKLQRITEARATAHLTHPEDLVFENGISGAKEALEDILYPVNNPSSVQTKYDGMPALIFGRGQDGKFIIVDKHMFNKVDGTGKQIYSPQDFEQYDVNRGVDRGKLYGIIERIWPGLEKEDRASTGFYWGDLLFSEPLQDNAGSLKFKANPTGVTYSVQTKSELGQFLSQKVAGIAVHQFIPATAFSTDQAVSLNGTTGNLTNDGDVAIISTKLPVTPKLKLDGSRVKQVEELISQYEAHVEDLFNNCPQSLKVFSGHFMTYVNHKIRTGNLKNLYRDFLEFINTRKMSDHLRQVILDYLAKHKSGVIGLFKIWISLYNLKMSVVEQLDQAAAQSPIKAFLDDGSESHEGYVANGRKYVNRMGFSKLHLGRNGL